jgi:hypothetical protein
MTDTPPLEFFRQQIDPDHECPGDDTCVYPPGLYMLVLKNPSDNDPKAFIHNFYVHLVQPGQFVGALVDFLDHTYQDNRGDDPAMIAHAKGRDMLRAAVEQIAPPPAVSEELAAFTESHLDHWRGLLG